MRDVSLHDEGFPTLCLNSSECFFGAITNRIGEQDPTTLAGIHDGYGLAGPDARAARPGTGDNAHLAIKSPTPVLHRSLNIASSSR